MRSPPIDPVIPERFPAEIAAVLAVTDRSFAVVSVMLVPGKAGFVAMPPPFLSYVV